MNESEANKLLKEIMKKVKKIKKKRIYANQFGDRFIIIIDEKPL